MASRFAAKLSKKQARSRSRFYKNMWRRSIQNREGINELSPEYLMEIYEKQNGLGFYSEMPMVERSKSDWKVSLERLDNDRGYIKQNTVLECHEFNGSFHFSKKLIESIPKMIDMELTFNPDEFSETLHLLNHGYQNSRNFRRCVICDKQLSGRYSVCPHHKEKYQTEIQAYRLLQRRLWDARDREQKKYKMGKITSINNISMSDVIEIAANQGFRCYYFGIPLSFEKFSPRTCSFERLTNEGRGYDNGNLRLVCKMFNAWHNHDSNCDAQGSANFSRYKTNQFLKTRFNRCIEYKHYYISSE